MRGAAVAVSLLLVASSATAAPGRCADVTVTQLSALSRPERADLLRSCDPEARVRLLLEHAHAQPELYDAVYDGLTSGEVPIGPALASAAGRTTVDADADFMLLMTVLIMLDDPGLPATREDRKALLEAARERARVVRNPEERKRALSILAFLIGPLEQPVPGAPAREAFLTQLVQSLIDDDSFHEAYLSSGDDVRLAVPACSNVTFRISHVSDDEEDDGTTHEYRVDFEIHSHRSFWVHQVGGQIVGAGTRPQDCAPLAIP